MSSSRSPGCSRSLRQISSSLRSCARSSESSRVREVRARVDQARPEQQLVERVRDVVVMAHRRPVAAQRVQPPGRRGLALPGSAAGAARAARRRAAAAAASRARPSRPSERSLTRRAQAEHALEIAVDVQRARHPRAPEPELVGRAQEVRDRLLVADQHDRRVGVVASDDRAVVPEAHRHGQLAERAGEHLHAVDPRRHGRRGGRRPSGRSVAASSTTPDRSLCILQPHYRCPYGGWARATAVTR